MESPDVRINARAMSLIMKKEGTLRSEVDPSVDHVAFTKHMKTPACTTWAPQIGQFDVPELLKNPAEMVIRAVPWNKALGVSEIYIERS